MTESTVPVQERSDEDSVSYPTTKAFRTLSPPKGGSGKGKRRVRNVLLAIWLPVVLLVLWYVLSLNSTSPFFPPLRLILQTWVAEFVEGDAWMQLLPSLRNLAIGYAAGVLIGYIAATLLWKLVWVRRAANPIVYFLYVLPAPALLPAMIALFGIGEMRQIALIAFGSIWATLLNALDGMRGIDQVKFDTAKAMRLGGLRTYFDVVVLGAAPQTAAGMRASLQVGIILMVVSEMVAAKSGIGFYILQAQTTFSIPKMWAGIVTLAIVGTILNYIYMGVEHVVLSWYHRSRALTS